MERLTYRDKFGQALAYKSQYAEVTNKLAHYEDLEEHLQKLYGECDELLDVCVNALERFELKIGNPQKTRMLTDDEADLWDKWRVANEQGRLIELPCAVGDTVYMIQNNADACEDCRWLEEGYCMDDYCSNKEVLDENENYYPSYPQYSDIPLCEKQFYEVVEHKPDLNWIFGQRNNFGKTIFLTEEEAKQALADM